MARALYREYRSRHFDEVVGQEHITELLKEAIKQKSISHAYLFTGPRGVGKTSVARILAHAINDLPYSEDTHLDIIEIDAASNRRIDDIRDLREKVHVAPTSAKYKVYIVDEVHMLTSESFNALLKTLEEPPAHVVFILATTELHKVPATIVSRTQRFQFRPAQPNKVVNHLKGIAAKEKIKVDDEALTLIAEHGGGSFRDSISLLDQLSSLKADKVTASVVENLLGLAPRTQIEALTDAIASHDESGSISLLKELFDGGNSAQTIIDQLLRTVPEKAKDQPHLYDLLYELIDAPRSYAPHLKLLAVVAKAAHKPKAPRSMPLEVAKPPHVSMELPRKKPQPSHKKKVPDTTPDTASETPKDSVPAKTINSDDFNWESIMDTLSKRYTALHSVLKRAEVTHAEDKLTLAFTYSLHRKKLEDSRYRSQLVALITDTYGSCPEIVVTMKDTEAAPSDENAAAVAAIMGGGVQVNV